MALTYKIEQFVKKISSPVVIEYNGEICEFPNGAVAYEQEYSKYLLVEEVKCADGKIYIVLKENDKINDTTWCGEEQVSFF